MALFGPHTGDYQVRLHASGSASASLEVTDPSSPTRLDAKLSFSRGANRSRVTIAPAQNDHFDRLAAHLDRVLAASRTST